MSKETRRFSTYPGNLAGERKTGKDSLGGGSGLALDLRGTVGTGGVHKESNSMTVSILPYCRWIALFIALASFRPRSIARSNRGFSIMAKSPVGKSGESFERVIEWVRVEIRSRVSPFFPRGLFDAVEREIWG